MFNQSHFLSRHWDAKHFIGAPDIGGTTTIATTWIFGGVVFASQSLDYVVKGANNEIIATGTATTNALGVLTIPVDARYSGLKVLIYVENVSMDMVTTGKVHGTQVVMVI